MITTQKLKSYQTKLEEEKKKNLLDLLGEQKPENFGNDVEDEGEEADEATAMSNRLAIVQALKERVNEIDAALNRIEIGEYGMCPKCGKEISEKLLDMVPESLLCEHCKKLN